MADNKEKLTPADYDRWGRTCVKFYDDPPKKNNRTPKKKNKSQLTRAEYDDLRQIEWVPFDPYAD